MKKQAYEQLEESNSSLRHSLQLTSVIIACLAGIILFFMIWGSIVEGRLLEENQDLKEQCEGVWTIEYTCNYDWMNQTIISDYYGFESYESALKNINEYEECEVIQ